METKDSRQNPPGINEPNFPTKIVRIRSPWTLILMLLVAATLASGFSSRAEATTIQTVVAACPGCASAGDLLTFATSYFAQYNNAAPPGYTGTVNPSATPLCTSSGAQNGTNLLVISALVPISEFFYECLLHTGTGIGTFTLVVKPADSGANSDSAANDAILIGRSAKTGEIDLPGTISLTGDPQEAVSAYLSSADGVPQSGASSISLWHGITNFPQAVQGTFTNTQTGETFTLWNGDTITVTDSNGNTAKFMWTPLSTVQWALVPNSVRDKNGNPPGKTPTAALPAGGSLTVALPGGQITTIVTPYQAPAGDPPLPRGTVTIDPDPFGTAAIVGCINGGACSAIPGL